MIELKTIFYNFLPQTNKTDTDRDKCIDKCILTFYLSDGSVKNFVLTGLELDPGYMTTDRLYDKLKTYLEETVGMTDYMAYFDVLDDFVLDFTRVLLEGTKSPNE